MRDSWLNIQSRSGKGGLYLAGKWGQENIFACHFPAPILPAKIDHANSLDYGVMAACLR